MSSNICRFLTEVLKYHSKIRSFKALLTHCGILSGFKRGFWEQAIGSNGSWWFSGIILEPKNKFQKWSLSTFVRNVKDVTYPHSPGKLFIRPSVLHVPARWWESGMGLWQRIHASYTVCCLPRWLVTRAYCLFSSLPRWLVTRAYCLFSSHRDIVF